MTRPHSSSSIVHARQHATAPGERARAASLVRLRITDAYRPELDAIVASAARSVGASVGAVTVLLGRRQVMIACVGTDANVIPREVSLCTHVTACRSPIVLRDVARDPYFAANPLVATDGTGHRSYCGVPISDDDGTVLAVLCVIDGTPTDFQPNHVAELELLARTAASLLLGSSRAIAPRQPFQQPYQARRDDGANVLPLDRDPLHRWIVRGGHTADEVASELARRRSARRRRQRDGRRRAG